MTREEANQILDYRLAELNGRAVAGPDETANQPVPDGYVRLGVSAAPYTVALDEIEADPTCHPNGFWGPERDYINTLAKYPLAARYQDQINGGHIGQNYYIPKGGKSLANANPAFADTQAECERGNAARAIL